MNPLRILVIDDDIGMTELLSLLLAPASAEIITANSGREGILAAQHHHPDLIILDLMLPTMDGWTVCQSVRTFCDAPILILTAMDSPAAIAQALDAGADDYLLKPVSCGMLIAHLKKLLRRTKIPLPAFAVLAESPRGTI